MDRTKNITKVFETIGKIENMCFEPSSENSRFCKICGMYFIDDVHFRMKS